MTNSIEKNHSSSYSQFIFSENPIESQKSYSPTSDSIQKSSSCFELSVLSVEQHTVSSSEDVERLAKVDADYSEYAIQLYRAASTVLIEFCERFHPEEFEKSMTVSANNPEDDINLVRMNRMFGRYDIDLEQLIRAWLYRSPKTSSSLDFIDSFRNQLTPYTSLNELHMQYIPQVRFAMIKSIYNHQSKLIDEVTQETLFSLVNSNTNDLMKFEKLIEKNNGRIQSAFEELIGLHSINLRQLSIALLEDSLDSLNILEIIQPTKWASSKHQLLALFASNLQGITSLKMLANDFIPFVQSIKIYLKPSGFFPTLFHYIKIVFCEIVNFFHFLFCFSPERERRYWINQLLL